MAEFSRVLTEKHIEGLRREIEDRPEGLIADLFRLWTPSGVPSLGNYGLRLAIRKNYLNLYEFGQSMARISFDRRCRPIATVHPKYVLRIFKGQPADGLSPSYVTIQGDEIRGRQPGLPERYTGTDMLTRWMEVARSYAGAEKTFVDRLVGANSSVIDLEMGLPALPGQRSAPRMDIVVLEKSEGQTKIAFWEAKCMNNPELRAEAEPGTEAEAAIFRQLKTYQDWVDEPQRNLQVRRAYANTAKILVDLHGIAQALTDSSVPFSDIIKEVASNEELPLLDARPRVVVEHGPKRSSFGRHEGRLKGCGYKVQIIEALDPRPMLGGAA